MAGPFFIPDLSSWEGNTPNFDAVAAMPDAVGCIIKSSQGLGPGVSPQHGHSLTWFKDNWPRVAAATAGAAAGGGDRRPGRGPDPDHPHGGDRPLGGRDHDPLD